MISLMTFDAAHAGQLLDNPHTLAAPFEPGGIDLLCCQSLTHTPDGRLELSRKLSAALELTCSCFVAGRPFSSSAPDAGPAGKGLATFTGRGIWVLNSGSFLVGEDDEATLVQFTLIRKYGTSVLALNLHLGVSRETQIRQLRDLFDHPLLCDPYGAVMLCANRTAILTGKQWQGICARSNYTLHRMPLTTPGGGLLGLFTARYAAVSTITVRHPDPALHFDAGHSPFQPALALTVDIQRIVSDKPNRPTFPLSFREQWLGYREHRAFA